MAAPQNTFTDLFSAESILIDWAREPGLQETRRALAETTEQTAASIEIVSSESANGGGVDLKTPWVGTAPTDRVGMAFSGGGIRSATYNLGLMQGLNDLKLLSKIDYLSTVSGGGYIGSWWTAWRYRKAINADDLFPSRPTDGTLSEPHAVRHVRTFSNYLVPRSGIFEVEFWNGVVAVLNGSVPTVFVAASLMSLLTWLYLVIAWLSLATPPAFSTASVVGVALVVFAGGEGWWWLSLYNDRVPLPRHSLAFSMSFSLLATALILVAWTVLLHFADDLPMSPQAGSPVELFSPFPWHGWTQVLSLFAPGIVCLAVMVVMIFVEFTGSFGHRSCRRTGPGLLALHRVLGRLGFLFLAWCVPATILCLAEVIRQRGLIVGTGSLGGTAAALLALLRGWLARTLQPGHKPGLGRKVRALVPQLLAYVALVAALLLVCIGIQLAFDNVLLTTLSYALPILIVTGALCFLDPVNCGLHAFYRNRLCRAYLGASNPALQPAQSKLQADPHPDDDWQGWSAHLWGQPGGPKKGEFRLPLHLICCAANELDADPLSNLSRGARSAVLSPLGFAIDDSWSQDAGVSLGSAVTASAAAFNSNMGSVSKQLGWAVQFLMCALNLRLGLWVRRPGAFPNFPWLKGWPYFCEMWGSTQSRAVQLSDGGHFENLALYELVRRHCRYILLSDVGADPEVAFDDLGNAVRRIREDFGVEIELDLSPLMPGPDGLARQHMVVGTIHYDAARDVSATDKGILLYFKPALTGDEPADVRQYKTRNVAFPNETTVDQFYDEAQWEAYRRLGQHAARAALDFISDLDASAGDRTVDEIFVRARLKWYPTPPEIPANSLELTNRCVQLEERLRTMAPKQLIAELFPETPVAAPTTTWDFDAVANSLHALVELMQVMEDIYFGCQLEEHWNHPLNSGWVNTFGRWAGAPIFQYWWPLLKGLYTDRFRNFIDRQIGIAHQPTLTVSTQAYTFASLPGGLAKSRAPGDFILANHDYWYGAWTLPAAGALPGQNVQVCLLRAQTTHDVWTWTFDGLFLVPHLRGLDLESQFLRRLIAQAEGSPAAPRKLTVTPSETGARNYWLGSAADRGDWSDTLLLYKRLGFKEEGNNFVYYL